MPKYLSDIGINVYLNTIQGVLESFLSSSGPRVFPLQYQNLDVFSLSISEVFVGGGSLLEVSGLYEAHIYSLLSGFFKEVQPEFQTGTSSGTGLSGKRENAN
jgi:hypothetical protein